ncbi:MAG: response regulator transcription factor [Bacteroidota bacterium]
MENIKLAIVEDDAVIRESVEAYMETHPSIQITFTVDSVEAFLEKARAAIQPQLDVLLLDIGLPGMTGIQGLYHIRQQYPNMDIIMLTTFEEDDKIFDALCAGACSYISKRTPLTKIREAIFTVYRGGSYMSPSIARKIAQRFMPKAKKKENALSERQMQIVQALVDGLSYKMIANKLNISLDTVRDHIKRIYRTLEVNSKAEVIKKVLKGDI